ncbi:nitroreductase [Xenophilus azovorans]|uniref:nitroreductase n=1 Tax=Xenophilus azovorans TaxID=151755 RepID=UPI000570F53A|nr:nitroreductase [Xenophilus azovorans]
MHADSATPRPVPDPLDFERLLDARASCRGFLPAPVPEATLGRILRAAQRTPSWNNVQPWQVIVTQPPATGKLRAALQEPQPEEAGFEIPPPSEYRGVYLERRRACGFGLYASVGIAKGDREASARQGAENFRLFGAPHMALVTSDRLLGTYGVLDCGAYVNNFMLAATANGVATIAQAALAQRSAFLRRWFGIAEDRLIVCGISLGYADPAHPANRFRTSRAPIEDTVRWVRE